MPIIYSAVVLIALTVFACCLYWIFTSKRVTSPDTLPQLPSDTNVNLVKKHPIGEVNTYRPIAFLTGLFIALIFATMVIEYKTVLKEEIDGFNYTEEIDTLFSIQIIEILTPPPIAKPQQKNRVEKDPTEFIETTKELIDQIIEPETSSVEKVVENITPPEDYDVEPIDDNEIIIVAEEPARFPGGPEAMMSFAYSNFNNTFVESAGNIIVKFVVEKDGSISNVEVVRGINRKLDNEAIRVIESMPQWTPARTGGRYVRQVFTLPFRLKVK